MTTEEKKGKKGRRRRKKEKGRDSPNLSSGLLVLFANAISLIWWTFHTAGPYFLIHVPLK
jgi:hypothetical protein